MDHYPNYYGSSIYSSQVRRVHIPSPIWRLPTELLLAIAYFLPVRHETHDYVLDISSLIAFSSISRAMRNVVLPSIYEGVPIYSVRQLRALQGVSPHLLGIIRELNIFMDIDFLRAWGSDSTIHPNQEYTLYPVLAYLLFRVPSLRALRIRVAHASGHRSAWTQFSLSRASGIPMSHALETCLRRYPGFRLLCLERIELDGFEDVESLLRRAPNLETLRLQLSAGFSRHANVQLVQSLKHVQKVRELVYPADTLQLADVTGSEEEGGTVEMLIALGQTLPNLQILDLQTRWYNREIYFCSSSRPISERALIQAVSFIPNIRILALPISVHSVEDLAILRTPLPRNHRDLNAIVPVRLEALSRVAAREQRTIEQLGLRSPRLRFVSFVRHATPDNRIEYSVRYSVNVITARRSGSSGTFPDLRPARVDIDDVKFLEAYEGQHATTPAM